MTPEDRKKLPERIWLQWDGTTPATEDDTWCADRINDDDTEYVRADALDAAEAELKQAKVIRGRMHEAHNYLLTELKAAEAVIEKLPKTADGVPLSHGDTVFLRSIKGGRVVQGRADTVSWEMECVDAETNSYSPTEIHGANMCYSTEAAARAAGREQG